MKEFSLYESNKIKGVAICLLLFHHMYRTIDDIELIGANSFINTEFLSRAAYCCRICVYIFAFITAFGISKKMLSCPNKSIIKMIFERYLKLIMPYWFTLILVWLFWKAAFGYSIIAHYDGRLLYIIADFFSVLELIGHTEKMFFGLFWYMNFAVIEIVLVPLVYRITEKLGWYSVLLTVVFYQTMPAIISSEYGGDYKWYIFSIECGCLFALNNYFEKIFITLSSLKVHTKMLIGMLLLVGSFAFPYIAWFSLNTEAFGVRQILHTLGALCILTFSYVFIHNSIVEKFLVYLGTCSADFFLLHVAIYRTASRVLRLTNIVIIQYMISMCICLAVVVVIRMLKEKTQYNRLIRSIINIINK